MEEGWGGCGVRVNSLDLGGVSCCRSVEEV